MNVHIISDVADKLAVPLVSTSSTNRFVVVMLMYLVFMCLRIFLYISYLATNQIRTYQAFLAIITSQHWTVQY